MSLSITDLKKGTLFQLDGNPYRVVEYGQKVVGRGGSIVNLKIKNLIDGSLHAKTLKGNEYVQPADIVMVNAQFLYADDKKAYFMDSKNYTTHEMANTSIEDTLQYLNEGACVQVMLFDDQPIGIEAPKNLYLKVTYTEDAVKGDTSSAITKDAKLETGAVIKVPPFIKTGDIISVDTTTGNYRERKK